MWLQDSNERKLLIIYFRKARARLQEKGCSPFDPMLISYLELVAAFDCEASIDEKAATAIDEKASINPKSQNNKYARFLDCLTLIFALTIMLCERELLGLTSRPKLGYKGNLNISLTPIGYDLGAKYNNPWKRWHLRWLEYKDSFLWPIIGFLLGCLMTYIITKVTSNP